jgi:hypothetical protein
MTPRRRSPDRAPGILVSASRDSTVRQQGFFRVRVHRKQRPQRNSSACMGTTRTASSSSDRSAPGRCCRHFRSVRGTVAVANGRRNWCIATGPQSGARCAAAASAAVGGARNCAVGSLKVAVTGDLAF